MGFSVFKAFLKLCSDTFIYLSMFEKDCKYWYKDKFLEVPLGKQHAQYIEEHFSEMFPGEKDEIRFSDDPFPLYEAYALGHGCARVGVVGPELYFEYEESFENPKEFNRNIAKNLPSSIKFISLNVPNLNTTLSKDEFLEKKDLFQTRRNIMKNKKLVKSSYEEDFEDAFKVYPWDINQVDYHSDEDLGLSAVIEMYGDEFVNVDDNTLNEVRDTLELYFDDDAYVRDWNINYPDEQIESIGDLGMSAEDLDVNSLALYFDYDAYGRDIRLEYNMVWDKAHECWVSIQNMDIDSLEEDNLVYLSNSRTAVTSSEKWEKDYKHYIPMKTDELVKLFWKTEDKDVKKAIEKALKMRPRNEDKFSVESKLLRKSIKSRRAIKSAESYGWVVESSDASRALDMWIEAVGEEQAYKDVVDTLSYDELAEAMAYIFRMNDFSEWDNGDDDDDEIESGCHGNSRKKGKKSVKSGIDFDEAEDAADIGYDDFKHGEHDNPFDPDEEPDLYDGWEVGYEKAKKESDF